jgi:methionyl aminopeptidase
MLTEGMVITIEPRLRARSATPAQEADGRTIRTADRSLAAHYAHTLVITRGAPLVLTAA